MNTLTHLSLFTGIGGFDIAAEWAGFETIGQCENADYPTKVLEKHWKEIHRWRDVREITAKSFREQTGIESPTVISGGFPCQPHSVAGKRKASDDERDLWREFARIICEIKPRWVVGENVPGLLSSEHGRYFGRILRDLAGGGIMSDGIVSLLHGSEQFIDESGFSLLPTMGACESRGSSRKRYKGSPDFKGAKMSEGLRNSCEDPMYLHPRFAEAVMGFPDSWTDLNV